MYKDNLSEWLPVINNTHNDNLGERLPIINNTQLLLAVW